MLQDLATYLSTSDFMPHGHCYLWRAPLVVLHAGSDTLIGTAYVVIALTLWGLVRKIRLPFSPMILSFGTFIGACGLTHLMEVWTLWEPEYWASGGVKLLTALASVATGAYLVKARPTIGAVATGAQLAEERRLELESKNAELERLYAQVKELDDARTRFFANASHELRTPLALVLGAIERAIPSCPPGARHDLEVGRRNARVLVRLVNDLLEVARIEEGRLVVRYARTDVGRLVRETAAQFELAASERRIALSVDAPEGLVADVDPEQVERVVANLVANAFQFVPDGGRVRLAAAGADGAVRIVVSDTGPGIPPELRAAVFERFRQDERLPRHGGAGLGLSIVKDFVEAHRGAIEAGEAEGGGARFTVTLPREAPAAVHVASAPPAAPARAPAGAELADEARPRAPGDDGTPGAGPEAPTALVVEDDPEMRRHVADVLAREFRVTTAADGEEGLRQAEALRPDVVVTDVMMPRMGGEQLVEALRRRPELAATPVVVLTAREDEALRVRLLRGGARDFVVKPFLAEELRARARNLARVKRSHEVLAGELATRGQDLEEAAREVARRNRELAVAVETARVAREQAERASQVKSTFLQMASHELRTPLTAMRLSVEVLRADRDRTLSQRQRDHVRRVDDSSRRLLGLIESLLEYTRVESGRLVVRPVQVDLVAVAGDVVDEVRPQAQKRLLGLDLAPPAAAVPPAETDPRLVRLVLLNLVVNAVKYTESGGVRVAVAHGPGGHVLSVEDSGPGIELADQARIFEPFEQLGPGLARSAQGVGLGLSLVRGIVDALGGTIALESAPGKGATFRVTLPPRPPAAPPHLASA